ncbi:MAG: hypothetical protein IPF78_10335 [Flavobacteriales bacterium]|nr:hypothetical protein [Flavobacteriales bacterium]
MEAAQAEVARKQQEEERELAEAAKRKEQEEKGKAKADAQAQKEATAKAKEDAKAQAKQEAAAREAQQARTAEVKPEPKPVAPPPIVEKEIRKVPKPRAAAVARDRKTTGEQRRAQPNSPAHR